MENVFIMDHPLIQHKISMLRNKNTGTNEFRMCFTDPAQGTKSAQYIGEHSLATKVAVLYDSSADYNSGINDAFVAAAEENGLEIVADEAYTADSNTDFSVQLKKIKDSGAELLFLPNYYADNALILQQAHDAGMDDVKKFGVDGMDGILGVENFDTSLAEGVMLLTPFSATSEDEKSQAFVKAYEDANKDEVPNQFAADTYDVIYAMKAAADAGTAFVFMGHGTSHTAKVSYSQMASQMAELGYDNVFIGTVEGEPEETACENVIAAVKDAGYKKVVLRPLMVVAGDHANNDMAGDDDDSWKSQFEASGAFDSIDCQIAGLGEIADVQKIYVNHTADAIANADLADTSAADENKTSDVQSAALADGTYTAAFNTDSSMFHVNEANGGQGTLTVKDGKMTIHISLASKNIVNLFVGTAEDAQKDGAALLEPTTDTVKYADGTEEEVYGFDVPVEALDQEFDLAILGKKGKWYDHKVSVADAKAAEE